jgi:glycerol-3-phosphate acyltransferase PlsY
VTAFDMCKSLIPLLVAAYILRDSSHLPRPTYLLWLLVGFAAVIGHMFPIFLRFKGGKGVATGAGLMVGLFPHYTYPALISIALFLAVFYATRYMSLASMTGAISFPILFIVIWTIWPQPIWTVQLPLTVVSVVLATMVVYRHRGNIARLLAGTEPKYGKNPAA